MKENVYAISASILAFVALFLAFSFVSAETNGTNMTDTNSTNVTIPTNETNSTNVTIPGNSTNSTNVTNPGNSTNMTSGNVTCKDREHRVEGRLRQYREGRDGHFRSFEALYRNLNASVARLDEKGYNVSQLEADLVILNVKIDKFKADYAIFIDKLNATRYSSCTNETTYKASLDAAKAQLKIVRIDAHDIKEFLKEEVRKHFRELRKEAREQAKQEGKEAREAIKDARDDLKENRSRGRDKNNSDDDDDDDDDDTNSTSNETGRAQ